MAVRYRVAAGHRFTCPTCGLEVGPAEVAVEDRGRSYCSWYCVGGDSAVTKSMAQLAREARNAVKNSGNSSGNLFDGVG